MGLFKKTKVPDGIKVVYYDGGLNGFMTNMPCQVLLTDSVLRITKVKPDITVTLDKNRIQSIDIYMRETEYMLKYHGDAASTSKSKSIEKMYFVVNYLKDNEQKHIDFWCTAFEISKIRKMRDLLLSTTAPTQYEL